MSENGGLAVVSLDFSSGHRMFSGNALIRKMSTPLQLQLLGTLLRGGVQYFLPVLNLSPVEVDRLDASLLDAARAIARLPLTATTMYLRYECRLPSLWALLMQHRCRLRLSLLHHPTAALPETRQPPAVRIIRLQAADWERRGRPGGTSASVAASWLDVTRHHVRRHNDAIAADGTPHAEVRWRVDAPAAPFQGKYLHCASTAAAFVARVTLGCVIKDARAAEIAFAGKDACDVDWRYHRSYAGVRPRAAPVAAHMRDIFFTTELDVAKMLPAAATHADLTPLSALGPAWLGGITTLSPAAGYRWIALRRARQGVNTLAMWPFGHRMSPEDDAPNFGAAVARRGCLLCDYAGAVDIWHLINECKHSQLTIWRQQAHMDLPGLVLKLIILLEEAYARDAVRFVPYRLRSERARFAAAAHAVRECLADYAALNHDAPGCRFLLHRFVVGLPFPAFVVPTHPSFQAPPAVRPGITTRHQVATAAEGGRPYADRYPLYTSPEDMPPVVEAIGVLFDAVFGPRRLLRGFATRWASRANSWILQLAGEFRGACGLTPLVVPDGDVDSVASDDDWADFEGDDLGY